MRSFSANLGFLFPELTLPDAVIAAGSAGFDAVEMHWPFGTPTDELKAALACANLPLLSLNTRPGKLEQGDFGLAALPERRNEAREAIEEAITYGLAVDANAVHVMAGKASGAEARTCFTDNLAFALDLSKDTKLQILVEPMNRHDVPGYHLASLKEAANLLEEMKEERLLIMLDCYHAGKNGEDIIAFAKEHMGKIGHVQFAGVPARAEPDHGDINYPELFNQLEAAGYNGFFGAEYKSTKPMTQSLAWLKAAIGPTAHEHWP